MQHLKLVARQPDEHASYTQRQHFPVLFFKEVIPGVFYLSLYERTIH